MKTLLRLEEAAIFCLAVFLFTLTTFSWWWFPVLLLLPDIGMLGYLMNPKSGAAIYNILHHKGIAVIAYIAGYFGAVPILELSGLIMLGHIALDRTLGYGLKYPDSFHRTHLGTIGSK